MPGHDEAAEMVWMPVPIGTQSIQVRGANGFWGGYSSGGFNLVSATAGVVRTVPTSTPPPAQQGGGDQQQPTATPSPTSGSSAPATRTSTPTATPVQSATPTATNTATTTPPVSTQRHSLKLDGSSAYAEAAARPEMNLTRSWTIETWFKDEAPNGYAHEYRVLIAKGEDAASEVPFFAKVGNGNLVAGLRTRGTNYFASYSLAAAGTRANAWHHLAASFDSTNRVLRLYVDGAQVANQTLAARTASGNALAVEIGRQGQGQNSEKAFLGDIDDVRIWNVVRSPSDIQANYRRELTTPLPGLVANWQFNSVSDGVATNLVSSSPGATLGGAAVLSADVHQ
jgi:hypothetical protein